MNTVSNQTELPWVAEARKHIGLKEATGRNDHPLLDKWWAQMGASWLRLQPYCGLYVAVNLKACDRYVVPNWFRAKAWDRPDLMTELAVPSYGCLVVFNRKGGGHIGIVVGITLDGFLMVLGANQSNRVSIAPFSPNRVEGYFWPSKIIEGKVVKSYPAPIRSTLPILESSGQLSQNEE